MKSLSVRYLAHIADILSSTVWDIGMEEISILYTSNCKRIFNFCLQTGLIVSISMKCWRTLIILMRLKKARNILNRYRETMPNWGRLINNIFKNKKKSERKKRRSDKNRRRLKRKKKLKRLRRKRRRNNPNIIDLAHLLKILNNKYLSYQTRSD